MTRFTLKSHALIVRDREVVRAVPRPLSTDWFLLLRLLRNPDAPIEAQLGTAPRLRALLRELQREGFAELGAVDVHAGGDGAIRLTSSKPAVVEGLEHDPLPARRAA